jgi:hypothetical protein
MRQRIDALVDAATVIGFSIMSLVLLIALAL